MLSFKPCPAINCDRGKSLVPGTTEICNCPVCHGTGSIKEMREQRQVILEGYIDARGFDSAIHYSPAVGCEVTDKQKPIDIMRIRRIYNKKPSNYWFISRNKIKVWKKVKITVEEIE